MTTTTTTTQTAPLLAPAFPKHAILSSLGASIAHINPELAETTLILDCLTPSRSATTRCARFSLPLTITAGPLSIGYVAEYPWYEIYVPKATDTESVTCTFSVDTESDYENGREKAICHTRRVSYTALWSSQGTSYTMLSVSTYSGEQIEYVGVSVTAGWDAVETGGLTSGVVPTAEPGMGTGESSLGPEPTAGLDGDDGLEGVEHGVSDSSLGSDSASKAWIAGPLIGGLVGVGLIAVVIWWIWRRRRGQQTKIASGPGSTAEFESVELQGKDIFSGGSKISGKAEMGVREVVTAELPVVGAQKDVRMHEMP